MIKLGYINYSIESEKDNQVKTIVDYCMFHKVKLKKIITDNNAERISLISNCYKDDKVILYVDRFTSLGRNNAHCLNILKYLVNNGVSVHICDSDLMFDLSDKGIEALKMLDMIYNSFVKQIRVRTKESLKKVKESGKHLGRPYGFHYRKLDDHKDEIISMLKAGYTKMDIKRKFGCTYATLLRYVNEIEK